MIYKTLSNGVQIPVIGFGTFKITDPKECEEAVLTALKVGYRLIDTAEVYNNEEYVGNAIKKSGIPREEIFVTTKINFRKPDTAEEELLESFRKLQLDYIDLVLIHWPYNDYYKIWHVLEKYYEMGKIRAIGVSNFGPARLIDLVKFNKIVPHVNQIEAHLYAQREEDLKWNNYYNVVSEAYAPFAQNKIPELFNDPVATKIAQKHNKTIAQISIRYLIQLGFVVIPKSSHENRIKENFDVLDFELDENDMHELADINKNQIVCGNSENPNKIFNMKV